MNTLIRNFLVRFCFFHESVVSFAIEKYSLTVEVDADVLIFARVVWSM